MARHDQACRECIGELMERDGDDKVRMEEWRRRRNVFEPDARPDPEHEEVLAEEAAGEPAKAKAQKPGLAACTPAQEGGSSSSGAGTASGPAKEAQGAKRRAEQPLEQLDPRTPDHLDEEST